MSWPLPRRIVLGCIALVGLATLVAFQTTSRAEARAPVDAGDATAIATPGPAWVPEVVTAPGLPLQCADGTWTRTVVRAGCAHHRGLAY
jgi:hypothetical protein